MQEDATAACDLEPRDVDHARARALRELQGVDCDRGARSCRCRHFFTYGDTFWPLMVKPAVP
jgi:hypothetical protein